MVQLHVAPSGAAHDVITPTELAGGTISVKLLQFVGQADGQETIHAAGLINGGPQHSILAAPQSTSVPAGLTRTFLPPSVSQKTADTGQSLTEKPKLAAALTNDCHSMEYWLGIKRFTPGKTVTCLQGRVCALIERTLGGLTEATTTLNPSVKHWLTH